MTASTPLTLGRWTLACAVAETIGMTAAAGASKAVLLLSDESGAAGGRTVALGLIVAGGLVEGVALGVAQSATLARRWPALRRGRYALATIVVAGLGWAAGSAPSVFAADDGGAEPPLALMLAGGAGIGLVMGPLLGAAQAWTMRPAVRHPWRWVAANAVAWPPVMVAIFLGASRPDEGWSVPAVLGVGAVTGLVAGSLLGLVTGTWLPSLDGQPIQNRVVLRLLGARRFGLDRHVVGLAVRGRRSGRVFRFPVQYAEDDAGLVVVPGGAERKTWWRNLRGGATPIEVLLAGRWQPAAAEVLRPDDPARAQALSTYQGRWPKVRLDPDAPVVRIRVETSTARLSSTSGPQRPRRR
jgi:hypothetical protein